jgi:hypothetical protein
MEIAKEEITSGVIFERSKKKLTKLYKGAIID